MQTPSLRQLPNGVYAWWEKDADVDLSHIGPLPAFGHEDCKHRYYLLTCKQYEYLLRRSSGRCEMCGLPWHENEFGRLYIDHDTALGRWAVRGLLCRRCNAVERFGWFGARTYHANAWYLSELAATGVPLRRRQPRVGTIVLDFAYRPWRRTAAGWLPVEKRPRILWPHTWDELHFLYGPHNLHVVGGAA